MRHQLTTRMLRIRTPLFIRRVRAAIGKELVDVVDRLDPDHHVGFVTTEADKGEDVKADYVDAITKIAEDCGLRVSVLPFPIRGKLTYDVAVRIRHDA